MKPRLITALALLILVLLFALQNAAPTQIELLFWQLALPRYLLILVMLLVGILVGWFLHAARTALRKRPRRARRTPEAGGLP